MTQDFQFECFTELKKTQASKKESKRPETKREVFVGLVGIGRKRDWMML
jgi:hypothetical protein